MPYVAVQDIITEANPHGRRNYWSADFLAELPDEAVDTLVEHATQPVSPFSHDAARAPAAARSHACPRTTTAFGERTRRSTRTTSRCGRTRPRTSATSRTRATIAAAMKPWTTGRAYLNYIGDEGLHRVEASFGEKKYARLQAIKAEWDPDERVPPQPEHQARATTSGRCATAPYFARRSALASMNAMRSLVGRRPSAP